MSTRRRAEDSAVARRGEVDKVISLFLGGYTSDSHEAFHMMKKLILILLFFPLLAFAQDTQQSPADKQTQALDALNWQRGPTTGAIGSHATIVVPQGYVFLDSQNTRKFLEILGNIPSDNKYMIAPQSLNWFSIFSFNETGYVKDDEKIDPSALLKQLKDSDGPENEERQRLHMTLMYTDDWAVEPHYDTQTKQLEWGIRLHDSTGAQSVNYTTRILGRTGVMSATLVTDNNTLMADTKAFKHMLTGFSYTPGNTYAEFKPGDKVAEYGLAALVLGGAAVVAAKKGFFAVIAGALAAFWKVIAAAVVAVFASIAKIFKKKQ